MKKMLILAVSVFFSSSVLASADHYFRKDGNHVQHLKVTKRDGEVNILLDVDFEANSGETGEKACSVEIAGEAKVVSENELTYKQQASGEAHYCELKIHLTDDDAKIEQSADCAKYFAGGFCQFGSEGKSLMKIK
jgi:hypothetical protein